MINIDFKQTSFYAYFSADSPEKFEEYVNFCKSIYLTFDMETKAWICPVKRIDELILWIDRRNWNFSFSREADKKFEEVQKDKLKSDIEFYRRRIFDKSILNGKIVPYNYQLQAIDWRLKRSAYLDCFDAGLGKTFSNICVFSQLYKNKEIDGIVIIVPIGLSFHWLRQIVMFTNVFTEDDIIIIDNSLKVKAFSKYKDKKIIIIRQDLLADVVASYRKEYAPAKSLKNLKWGSAEFVDIKKEWGKENLLILVDEAHNFNHMSAIKTKALFNIKKFFKYRLLLTATPAINGFINMYSLLKFVDSSIIPFEEDAFKLWIANSLGNKWDRLAINTYDTKKVQKVMKDYFHVFSQAKKEDIDEVKTKKIIKQIECDLTPIQKKLYQLIVDRELKTLQDEYSTLTWKLLLNKLHLILEVFDNPELLKKRHYNDSEIMELLNKWDMKDDPKFIYLKNRVDEICNNQNKKIIIYDIHPDTIDSLSERFKSYKPLIIHGALKVNNKEKDRQEKQDLFNYDKEHRMIILSLYTSSAGINLQHGASNIIVNTLSHDATFFRQAQDRIYRVDSKVNSLIELPYYSRSLDNIRMKRNFDRIELNSKMDKILTQEDLNRLMNGTYN